LHIKSDNCEETAVVALTINVRSAAGHHSDESHAQKMNEGFRSEMT